MKIHHFGITIGILLMSLTANAFETGDTVRLYGEHKDNVYAAGGTIFSSAVIGGDLLASGGTVVIDGSVASDVLIMGGDVTVSAQIGDDLRIMAGSTVLKSSIGGDLLFAGGELSLAPDTVVMGNTWLAGGQMDLGGEFHRDLNVAAGNIILSGHIHGNVNLEAETISIEPGTRIDGSLSYSSPNKATIHPDAQIQGQVYYKPSEAWQRAHKGPSIFTLLTLMLTALVFYLLFTNFSKASSTMLQQEYWKGLGFGLVMLLVVPFVAIFAMTIVLGVWIGLILLASYGIALLVGSFLGMYCTSEVLARLIRFELNTKGRSLLAIIATYILLGILLYIPVLGGLTAFVIMLSGLGAGTIVLFRKYTGEAGK